MEPRSRLYVQVPADYGNFWAAGPGTPLLALMGLRADCSALLNLHLQMVLYSVRWRTGGFISDGALHHLALPVSERTAKRYGELLAESGFLERREGGYFVPAAIEWAAIRIGERDRIPDSLRKKVYERDGYRCVQCGTPEELSLDHIIPWSLNGPDTEKNLRTLCVPHNSSKGARI